MRRWMYRLMLLLPVMALVVSACAGIDSGTGANTSGLDVASPLTLEQADQVAGTFLQAWENSDYATMYELISPNSRDAYTETDFSDQYTSAATQITLNTLETQVINSLRQGTTATTLYNVVFQTEMFGEIIDNDRTLRLIETPSGWRVAWSRMDIFADLAEGARLERLQTLPGRGNIYDRNGKVLADQNGRSVGVYLVRQEVPDEQGCIALMSLILKREEDQIASRFNRFLPETRFLMGEIDPETFERNQSALLQLCGVGDDDYDTYIRNTRRYFGDLAPHIVGYVGQIQPAQVEEYERRGYPRDALIGQSGIERTYEEYLAGKPGGRLLIISPTGETLREIARTSPEPGQSVYLTIDRDLQESVQIAFVEAYNEATPTWTQTSRGAAGVVMQVKTGEILAAVSYPGFNPSLFNPDSLLDSSERAQAIADLNSDPRTPLLNRVTQGRIPAGSVFKIVSTAAGLDSGVFSPQTTVMCTGIWYGEQYGDGRPFRTDWKETGHGITNFSKALTGSCDPYYWELGVALHNADPQLLTEYAYKMGLGVPTGLEDLSEEIGQVPNADLVFRTDARSWNISDTLNMVIGQGQMQNTPLQIVRMVASVVNGGQLLKPLFVDRVQIIGEEPVYTAQPEVISQLDFDAQVYEVIQEAMCNVTLDPVNGTAHYIFEEWYPFQARNGFNVTVCGKTGTSETGGETTKPQAWFVAYAPREDPEIAVAVVVENSCEGSEVAAPIVRRIIEDYYGMPHSTWPGLWTTGCIPLGE